MLWAIKMVFNMAVYKNTGVIPRILITEAGDYVRLAPGAVSANIKVDVTNPVIAAYLDAGEIAEVKPKPSKASEIAD